MVASISKLISKLKSPIPIKLHFKKRKGEKQIYIIVCFLDIFSILFTLIKYQY